MCPDIFPSVGLLGHRGVLYLWHLIPSWDPRGSYQFPYPATLFSTPSPGVVICRLPKNGHWDRCELIPQSRFDFISLLGWDGDPLFHCLWRSVYLVLGKVSSGLLPLFSDGFGLFFVCCCWVVSVVELVILKP